MVVATIDGQVESWENNGGGREDLVAWSCGERVTVCVGLVSVVWNLLSEDETYSEMGRVVHKLIWACQEGYGHGND